MIGDGLLIFLWVSGKRGSGWGWGSGPGSIFFFFFKVCCFRVKVRVRVSISVNPNLKTAFFRKKDRPDPEPAFYWHPFLYVNSSSFWNHLNQDYIARTSCPQLDIGFLLSETSHWSGTSPIIYCVRGTRTQPLICVGCSVHYWVSCAINKGGFFEIAFSSSSSTHICLALRRLLTFCLTLTR